jgi:3',5'-cyclic AMP phosphodiesterase CpdA
VRWGWIAAAWVAAGCFEYSPHELPSHPSERDLHRKALGRLAATAPPSPLRFAVLGDTQLELDDAERAIESLGRRGDLALVVQVGDFTHLGLMAEYRLMKDVMDRLPVPWLVAFGNHDSLGNGGDIFARMFGPTDLAFEHGGTRFVLLDTNSVEAGFDGRIPDLGWLASQLGPGPDHDRIVVLSHIEPQSGDFDPRLRDGFHALLRDGGVRLSIHGHEHRFYEYEREGVRYVVADAVDDRHYLVVTAEPGGAFTVERVAF